ncbi:unnamed protein product, partial [Oppiella nova]
MTTQRKMSKDSQQSVHKEKDISPAQLAIFRFVGIFVFSIPVVVKNGSNVFGPKGVRHILVLRSISGATSLFFTFYAFRLLSLTDASIITFSIPESCGIFD